MQRPGGAEDLGQIPELPVVYQASQRLTGVPRRVSKPIRARPRQEGEQRVRVPKSSERSPETVPSHSPPNECHIFKTMGEPILLQDLHKNELPGNRS